MPEADIILFSMPRVALVGANVASLLAGRKKQVDMERINKQQH